MFSMIGSCAALNLPAEMDEDEDEDEDVHVHVEQRTDDLARPVNEPLLYISHYLNNLASSFSLLLTFFHSACLASLCFSCYGCQRRILSLPSTLLYPIDIRCWAARGTPNLCQVQICPQLWAGGFHVFLRSGGFTELFLGKSYLLMFEQGMCGTFDGLVLSM